MKVPVQVLLRSFTLPHLHGFYSKLHCKHAHKRIAKCMSTSKLNESLCRNAEKKHRLHLDEEEMNCRVAAENVQTRNNLYH